MTASGTPQRSIRVDDETWDAAKKAAAEAGTTISQILYLTCRELAGLGALDSRTKDRPPPKQRQLRRPPCPTDHAERLESGGHLWCMQCGRRFR